jgi:hypothetical protein
MGLLLGLLAGMLCLFLAIGKLENLVGLIALGGTGIGLLVGIIRRPSLGFIAQAIDFEARLKDRVHTALQFSLAQPLSVYHELQLRDATQALSAHAGSGVFPWRWPREGTWAVVCLVVAVTVTTLVPRPQAVEAKWSGPPRAIQIEVEELSADFDAFEELSEELESDEIKELAAKLKEMLSGMENQAQSGNEAMLQLARMSAEVESASAQFDTLLLEQMMHELAEGFGALEGFERTADMLQTGKYDQASQALQQFGQQIGSGAMAVPSSGGLLDGRLGQLAQQATAMGLSELGSELLSLRKAILTGSRSECEGALKRLGKLLGKYGKRVRIKRALNAQLARLTQCKQCLSSYCKNCRNGGSCQGGGCRGQGIKFGPPTLTFNKSDSGSQSAGTAISMNLFDKATDLRGRRSEAGLSGQWGEGDSEVEIEISPEGRQQAARQYRRAYAKYRKISNAVMTEESIPLAHRQIIKRYFESIHPDRVEANDIVPEVRDMLSKGGNEVENLKQEQE